MNWEILNLDSLTDNEKEKVDAFILDETSNGEFISTIKYLSYHPEGRFIEDSIIIKDKDSGVIKSVFMAASKTSQRDGIISHPGTTFSGLIVSRKLNIKELQKSVDLINDYYKKKYKTIEIRTAPPIYSSQLNQELDYLLLKNGYSAGFNALANVINLSKIKEKEEIFLIYEAKRRNHIRKAIKEARYSFNQCTNIDKNIWDNMNANLQLKYKSQTTHSYCEINGLHKNFETQIIPYKTCRENGAYGAFALVYKFKNVFHTQYLDVNYELVHEYPNLFLIHNLINIAFEQGYQYFSFGASTEEAGQYLNEGLFNYKKGFGGGAILLPVYKKRWE